jgi:hypothetical protein
MVPPVPDQARQDDYRLVRWEDKCKCKEDKDLKPSSPFAVYYPLEYLGKDRKRENKNRKDRTEKQHTWVTL